MRTVVNEECLVACMEYCDDVLRAEKVFRADALTADIQETLKIDCPYSECTMADELYIKESPFGRSVRYGMFGSVCFLASFNDPGQQG